MYLFPWTWLLLVSIFFNRAKNFRSVAGMDRLLVCLAVVPITFFLSISPVRTMLPHWSLIGFVALFPLAGALGALVGGESQARAAVAGVRRHGALSCCGGLTLAHARLGIVQFPFKDPLTEMSGWDSLGPELKARGIIGQPKTFVFTDRWYESGQLAFALQRSPGPLLQLRRFARLRPVERSGDWIGWDGILITTRECPREIRQLSLFFEKIELIDEFPMTRGGAPFRTVHVWRCTHQERPFPYRYGEKFYLLPDEDEVE